MLENMLAESLQRDKIPPTPTNEGIGYDTEQSDVEAPGMLELGGMHSTPLLPTLQSPCRPEVLASDWVLSMSQIEVNCVLMLN